MANGCSFPLMNRLFHIPCTTLALHFVFRCEMFVTQKGNFMVQWLQKLSLYLGSCNQSDFVFLSWRWKNLRIWMVVSILGHFVLHRCEFCDFVSKSSALMYWDRVCDAWFARASLLNLFAHTTKSIKSIGTFVKLYYASHVAFQTSFCRWRSISVKGIFIKYLCIHANNTILS